jgi:hypothetical protein
MSTTTACERTDVDTYAFEVDFGDMRVSFETDVDGRVLFAHETYTWADLPVDVVDSDEFRLLVARVFEEQVCLGCDR